MKVAFFFTYGYSLKSWENSGIIFRELKILKDLSEEYNYKFKLFTYGDKSDYEVLTKYEKFEIIPIYSLIKKSKFKYVNIFKSLIIPFKLKQNIIDCEIVHQHQLQGSWVSVLIKIFYKIPLVVRTGYDVYTFAKHDKKSKLKIFAFKLLTKLSIRYCDLYTVTSKCDYDILEKNFNSYIKKVKIRPNYVDFVESNDILQRPKNKILSVGRLVNQKNFETLINQFANNLDDIEIDIVGSGELKDKLTKLASRSGVKLNIIDNLSNTNLMKLYQKYKFFISTSIFEGNPKTILEAMASGCIVIASDINNHIELIDNYNNGILYSLDNPSLIQIIKNLNNNDLEARKVSHNAITTVKKINSIEVLSKNMNGDYKNLLNTF